jgi:hypothetical protein
MHQRLLNFVDNQQNNNFHNIRDLPLPVTHSCLKKKRKLNFNNILELKY